MAGDLPKLKPICPVYSVRLRTLFRLHLESVHELVFADVGECEIRGHTLELHRLPDAVFDSCWLRQVVILQGIEGRRYVEGRDAFDGLLPGRGVVLSR